MDWTFPWLLKGIQRGDGRKESSAQCPGELSLVQSTHVCPFKPRQTFEGAVLHCTLSDAGVRAVVVATAAGVGAESAPPFHSSERVSEEPKVTGPGSGEATSSQVF